MILFLLAAGLPNVVSPVKAAPPPRTPVEISAAIERARTSLPVPVGVPVHDEAGGIVGTVEKVQGTMLTLITGRHKIKLPASAITRQGSIYVIKATAAQLDTIMSGVNRPKPASAK